MSMDAPSSRPPAAQSVLPDGPLAQSQESQAHHAIWELLESVTDPEIPVVNLREMGILRAVASTRSCSRSSTCARCARARRAWRW